MAVTATGSTALDVPSLVSQLMSLERRPIDKLNAKVTDFQAKITSFGTLRGLVSGFQSALAGLKSSLESYSATPSDASLLSASADSTAAAGNFSVVVSQLARAQNLVATGRPSDTTLISSAASTVTFTVGGTSTDVSIPANASLRDIRDAINAAGIGVTASIVNDGSATPYRLALTATDSGTAKAVSTIAVSGDSSVASLLTYNNLPTPSSMTEAVTAANASLTVNGIAISSASNTISGAMQGVMLTLKNVTSTAVTLSVARDTGAINTAAAKVVEAYNALASQLKSRSAYGNATTQAGALAGDGTVRQMIDQLRGIFMSPASGGTLSYLAQVGVSTQTDGTLKLDGSKLNSAMATDFSDVVNLFNSASGFATRMDTWATSTLQAGGLIDIRTKGLDKSIQDYNTKIASLERRMTALQKQYTTTYSNLNLFLANMNSTSTYLSSQLSTSA